MYFSFFWHSIIVLCHELLYYSYYPDQFCPEANCLQFEPVPTDLLSAISVKSELLAGKRSLELPLHSGVDGFAEFCLPCYVEPPRMTRLA
jgi:hypothetical protein